MNQISRFRAKDNQELIEYLKSKGIIKSLKIYRTMCLVDRRKFMTDFDLFNDAYIDAPQSIGHGRNISAPHMLGIVLENLEDKLINGNKALTIRCCTGYLTTCMAVLLGPNGCAVNIESIPEFHKRTRKSIENHYPDLLKNEQIKLFVENDSYGYPPEAPYDVIYVGAAAEEVPQTFIDQLAVGGRLIMPIGTENDGQTLMKIDKTYEGRIEKQSLMFVRYGTLDLSEKRMGKIQDTSIDREKFLNIIASLEGNNALKGKEIIDSEHASQFNNSKIEELNLRKIAKPHRHAQVENNNTNDTPQSPMKLNCDREISTVDKEANIEIRRLENKFNALKNETVELKKLLKVHIDQQTTLTQLSEIDSEFKMKIGKWNKQIENKTESLGKDLKILERKLNKKISKIKCMVGEEITEGKDSASDHIVLFEDTIEIIEQKLKALEMKIEEKNSIEMMNNSRSIEKLMENDNRQWRIVMDKLTSMEKHSHSFPSENLVEQNYFSIFYIIIAVHAILVVSKKFSQ